VAFDFGGTIVNLLVMSEASSLIAPALVGEPETGARFQLTVWVDDTDAVVEVLAARGVTLLNGPMNRSWGMRTAAFADPDGHIWEVAQTIGKGG
jgi:catechol 2,3-dioxygenase-like lactoylglutathione lyase family enzyme